MIFTPRKREEEEEKHISSIDYFIDEEKKDVVYRFSIKIPSRMGEFKESVADSYLFSKQV